MRDYPSGAQSGGLVAAVDFNAEQALIQIDISDGSETVLDIPEDARLMGWWGDTLLYRTRDLIRSVDGGYSMAAGLEAFGAEWMFAAEESSRTRTKKRGRSITDHPRNYRFLPDR